MQIDKNNWQIKIDEENKEEVMKYLGKDDLYSYHIGLYYGKCNSKTVHLNTSQIVACLIITTDQFRKYILGKEDRKIIGYKAPFDMWDGKIQKGKLFFWDEDNKNNYKSVGGTFYFPSELVEPYFTPVYEEEEKVIELHGWKVTKDKILNIEGRDCRGLIFKCFKEYSEIIKAYKELNKSHEIHTNII